MELMAMETMPTLAIVSISVEPSLLSPPRCLAAFLETNKKVFSVYVEMSKTIRFLQ